MAITNQLLDQIKNPILKELLELTLTGHVEGEIRNGGSAKKNPIQSSESVADLLPLNDLLGAVKLCNRLME